MNESRLSQATGPLGITLLVGLLLALSTLSVSAEPELESEAPGKLEFEGENLFTTAEGTFHGWWVAESRIDLETLSESFAIVEVDLSTVDTGSERRDDHLRTPDFFDVEKYRIAKVRVHSARPSEPTEEGHRRFSALFDIDLHGVQKSVEGEIVLENEDPLVFVGSLTLDRTDFGVGAPPSAWNPMSVRAEIPVRFRVEL